MKNKINEARLYFIIAKNINVAVIFRRGPSKFVQISKWNLDDDKIEFGQWFKGRIYEKESDISPDGEKLIYFCSKFNYRTVNDNDVTYSWTALSKLPYLYALCLWRNGGCWDGGGIFLDNNTVQLNNINRIPVPNKISEKIKVITNQNINSYKTTLERRMERDGWETIQEGIFKLIDLETSPVSSYQYITERTRKIMKYNKNKDKSVTHEILRYNSDNTLEQIIIHDLKTGKSEIIKDVPCVDWDKKNRLVFSKMGCIYYKDFENWENKLIYNFNSEVFINVVAPDWAKNFEI